MERVGNLQVGHVARHGVVTFARRDDQFAGCQHPQQLDRVQRHPRRPLDQTIDEGPRSVGDHSRDQLHHGGGGQRGEMDARGVGAARAPPRPAVEDLGAGQRYQQDRHLRPQRDHLLDEVEHPVVCPVKVLERHHHRAPLGESMEEHPPGGEQLGAVAGGSVLHAEQPLQAGLHPGAVVGIRHVLGEHRPQPGARPVLVVPFGDAGALAHHLPQRPEREAVAVCGRPTVMPVGGLGEAVEVVPELVDEATLSDPALADDRDQPDAPLPLRCVHAVLQQP